MNRIYYFKQGRDNHNHHQVWTPETMRRLNSLRVRERERADETFRRGIRATIYVLWCAFVIGLIWLVVS